MVTQNQIKFQSHQTTLMPGNYPILLGNYMQNKNPIEMQLFDSVCFFFFILFCTPADQRQITLCYGIEFWHKYLVSAAADYTIQQLANSILLHQIPLFFSCFLSFCCRRFYIDNRRNMQQISRSNRETKKKNGTNTINEYEIVRLK